MPHSVSVQPSPGASRPLTRARSQTSATSSAFSPWVMASKPRRISRARSELSRPVQVAGECGEPLGASRGDALARVDALPHELHGLEPHPGGARFVPGGLRLDGADGLLQLVVVEQCLGQPENGVHACVAVEAGHAEGGLEVADGGGGRGEQGGTAQFEEHVRVGLGERRLQEGALQATAGRVGGADGEVFAGRLAQLLDEFLVVVRVHLEEVP